MASIIFEPRGRIAYITINRPQVMNCLNAQALEELSQAWQEFAANRNLWVAVITGQGREAFCTGADLKELIPRITVGEFMAAPSLLYAFLKNFPIYKPIIAAVNGLCLAGGTELLQGTDIRIAVDEARFGLPEPRWGLFPAGGSTVRLPRQVPYCRAMEILLTGESMTAEEALGAGLINRVVRRDDLMSTATALAEKICENSPTAVQAIKESVLQCLDLPEERAYTIETLYGRAVFSGADAREGPSAFLEKRKPRFSSP